MWSEHGSNDNLKIWDSLRNCVFGECVGWEHQQAWSFHLSPSTHTCRDSLSTCCSVHLADWAHKVWENLPSQEREDSESHYHLNICWFHSSQDSPGTNTCKITSCTKRKREREEERETGDIPTQGGGLIQSMAAAEWSCMVVDHTHRHVTLKHFFKPSWKTTSQPWFCLYRWSSLCKPPTFFQSNIKHMVIWSIIALFSAH